MASLLDTLNLMMKPPPYISPKCLTTNPQMKVEILYLADFAVENAITSFLQAIFFD